MPAGRLFLIIVLLFRSNIRKSLILFTTIIKIIRPMTFYSLMGNALLITPLLDIKIATGDINVTKV